jgi:hypothetical protein
MVFRQFFNYRLSIVKEIRRRTDDRRRKTDDREQKTEDRRQKTEDGRQMTEKRIEGALFSSELSPRLQALGPRPFK